MSEFHKMKNRPLFRAELRHLPARPLGDRILIRQFPDDKETEGGLVKPDAAKQRYYAGTLLAAGDSAARKLFDNGVEVGDEIWFGKFAGVVEHWHHVVSPGMVEGCQHSSVWEFVPNSDGRWSIVDDNPGNVLELRACRGCGALRVTEEVIFANADDVICSVDLQVRIERGEVQRERREDTNGSTAYWWPTSALRPDGHEVNCEAESPLVPSDQAETCTTAPGVRTFYNQKEQA